MAIGQVRVDMVRYLGHRLAWKYVYGSDPVMVIDHLNGDRGDNRICNLRQADQSENLANSRKMKDTKFALKGVSLTNKHLSKTWYSANIVHRGVRYFLGNFETAEAANSVYLAKQKELCGEFANAG